MYRVTAYKDVISLVESQSALKLVFKTMQVLMTPGVLIGLSVDR